jgi:hypothetical protein
MLLEIGGIRMYSRNEFRFTPFVNLEIVIKNYIHLKKILILYNCYNDATKQNHFNNPFSFNIFSTL